MKKVIRFGICADVHYGTMPDEKNRLKTFIEYMEKEHVDFIINLGDFVPFQGGEEALELWNGFSGPGYHVLGNHDMDLCSKEEMVRLLGMEAPYYSFDHGMFHFVVLDTNGIHLDGQDIDYDHGNYYAYPKQLDWMSRRQLDWLVQDLERTDKPTILFSHQYLGDPVFGVNNAEVLTEILVNAKDSYGKRKVVACMNGHHHTDGVKIRNGIYYIFINGMSFFYMSPEIQITRFSKEISDRVPLLRETAPFAEPLFTIFTLTEDTISCQGRRTQFVGPSPLESGHCGHYGGNMSTPEIEEKRLRYR